MCCSPAGWPMIALAACYWRSIDGRRQAQTWCRPLVVLGTNALALFVLSGLLVKTLVLYQGCRQRTARGCRCTHWIYQHLFAPLAAPKNASLLFAIAALVVLYGVLEVLYRRRWFLRV